MSKRGFVKKGISIGAILLLLVIVYFVGNKMSVDSPSLATVTGAVYMDETYYQADSVTFIIDDSVVENDF